jgi:predicted secreted hydrolase
MHKAKVEWWYITGQLSDDSGQRYFFQYTVFHWRKFIFRGYANHLAVTDIENGKHYFEETKRLISRKCNTVDNMLSCPGSILRLRDNHFSLSARGDSITFDLKLESKKDPVWHGEEGKISMGKPWRSKHNSYYFSYPMLRVSGSISIPDPGNINNKLNIQVNGEAWFDKQWGNFNPSSWFWTSIRFDDGDMAMLFYFPETGHREGTYMPASGEAFPFTGFTVSFFDRDGYDGTGWNVTFSDEREEYTILPELETPFQETLYGITYWEGLCKLLNENGAEVGWCVVEVNR